MGNEHKVRVDEQYSQEDINEALVALERSRDAKKKEREKMNDPEYKERIKKQGQRATAKAAILKEKALAAGLSVSEQEVDEYLASKGKL